MSLRTVGPMEHIPHANPSSTQLPRPENSFHMPKHTRKRCSHTIISQNNVLRAFTVRINIAHASTN